MPPLCHLWLSLFPSRSMHIISFIFHSVFLLFSLSLILSVRIPADYYAKRMANNFRGKSKSSNRQQKVKNAKTYNAQAKIQQQQQQQQENKNLKYFTTVSDKRREYLVATRRAQPSWLAYLQTDRHRQRGRATKWQTDWLTEWLSDNQSAFDVTMPQKPQICRTPQD